MSKRKHALLTGYTFETTHKTLKCMQAHGKKVTGEGIVL